MIFPSSLTSRLVIAKNGFEGPEYFQAGDSSMKPGMVVMHDDADEVKVCTSTGAPFGIVGCDADHDLNTAYTAGERIPIFPLGCGVDMYVMSLDPAAQTVVKGSIMDTGDATTQAGTVRVKDTFIVATTTFNATAVTERNLSSAFWVGKALASGSITSATTRYVPVKLSF